MSNSIFTVHHVIPLDDLGEPTNTNEVKMIEDYALQKLGMCDSLDSAKRLIERFEELASVDDIYAFSEFNITEKSLFTLSDLDTIDAITMYYDPPISYSYSFSSYKTRYNHNVNVDELKKSE